MSKPFKDDDPRKWTYKFHIYVKHSLFKKYFETWSKILGTTYKDIGYLDGFAGRGEYDNTQKYGSPILALEALTENEEHFETCQCIFVEKNPENYGILMSLLEEKKKEFSSKVNIEPCCHEFSEILPNYLDVLQKKPFFVFLDPFGFKGIPLRDIQEILNQRQNEVFITLMTKNINRFIASKDHQNALSDLLGGKKYLQNIKNQEDVANLYAKRLHECARYVIHYQIGADDKKENLYYLIHASNHFLGFKIMKNIMFNEGKEGQFAFKGIKDLKTNSLLKFVAPKMEINYVKNCLFEEFKEKIVLYKEILEYTYIYTNYIEKHCNSALRELEKEKKIVVDRKSVKRHRGGFKDDYVIHFIPPDPPKDLFFFISKTEVEKKGEGMELEKAKRNGMKVISKISPFCEKIQIAGSIRRKKARVKDIEIVCKPIESSSNRLNKYIQDLDRKKKIKLIKNGEKYKQFSLLDNNRDEIIKVDLFIVLPPAQWGIIYLLRTGGAKFSKGFVTKIKPNYRIKNGQLEKKKTIKDGLGEREVYLPMKTSTERSVFEKIGWDYIEPENRE